MLVLVGIEFLLQVPLHLGVTAQQPDSDGGDAGEEAAWLAPCC